MSVKRDNELLRDECNRLADEAIQKAIYTFDPAEKLNLLDAAQAYRKMAEGHLETVLHAEQVRTKAFSGGKTGKTPATIARQEFLKSIFDELDAPSREAVAAWAAEKHAVQARKLWGRYGYEKLRLKILNFIKNNPLS